MYFVKDKSGRLMIQGFVKIVGVQKEASGLNWLCKLRIHRWKNLPGNAIRRCIRAGCFATQFRLDKGWKYITYEEVGTKKKTEIREKIDLKEKQQSEKQEGRMKSIKDRKS